MIKFKVVSGEVMVDDRKGKQTIVPTAGMTMPFRGANCIIATTKKGKAVLVIEGQQVDLPPSSLIRIKPEGRSFLRKHSENFSSSWKLFFGRLWAKVAKDDWDESEAIHIPNAAVGVRG